jgi:hypothetical protein
MRGELGTFSVAEILQLIGSQEKSGLLTVKSKGKSAVLFFENGQVVSSRERRQGARDPFLFYLHENSAIGLEDLNKVMEIRQGDGGDTVDILIGEKIIDREALAARLSEYATNTLETIVKWETGTYDFRASDGANPDKDLMKPLRLEAILMEALRRKDEVEEIRRFLPSFDTRIKICEPNIEELQLNDDDASVLILIDGKKTIDEILEESSGDEVETLDTLEKLFALGVVSIAEKQALPGRMMASSPVRSAALAVGIVIAAIVLRMFVFAPSPSGENNTNGLRASAADFVDSREIQNLHFALDAYRQVNGSYPGGLGELVTAGLLLESQIQDRHGDVYSYMLVAAEDRYVLPPM